MPQKTFLIKLAEGLRQVAGEDIEKKVMEGSSEINSGSTGAKTAKWAKKAMDRLDSLVPDEEQRKEIVGNCCCYEEGRMKKAKAIYQDSKDPDEFIGRLAWARIVGTKITMDRNTINVFYDRCYCGLVKSTKENISKTYCLCSRKYTQKMFEGIFERPLKVELLQSIISGGNECEFAVYL